MTTFRILLIGGTGSIGREVARRALADGHDVRVHTRSPGRVPQGTTAIAGDLTDPASFAAAVDGIDAVVFTRGAPLRELGGARRRLRRCAQHPRGDRRPSGAHRADDRDRRGQPRRRHPRLEALLRAPRARLRPPSTIVRPGWFDYNEDDQRQLHFLQGDRRWAGSPADGVIARSQIADVRVDALTTDAAIGKTLELVAERGEAQADLEPLFAALGADRGLDAAADTDNMPLDAEPADVRADLDRVSGR